MATIRDAGVTAGTAVGTMVWNSVQPSPVAWALGEILVGALFMSQNPKGIAGFAVTGVVTGATIDLLVRGGVLQPQRVQGFRLQRVQGFRHPVEISSSRFTQFR